MKMIVAIIKPGKLDDVREALVEQGILGLTVSEVRGFGRQMGHKEIYRGAEYEVSYVPKIKIEIVVDEGFVDAIVETIASTAKTDSIGDGKIFVLNVEQALRIRTGETGTGAL